MRKILTTNIVVRRRSEPVTFSSAYVAEPVLEKNMVPADWASYVSLMCKIAEELGIDRNVVFSALDEDEPHPDVEKVDAEFRRRYETAELCPVVPEWWGIGKVNVKVFVPRI